MATWSMFAQSVRPTQQIYREIPFPPFTYARSFLLLAEIAEVSGQARAFFVFWAPLATRGHCVLPNETPSRTTLYVLLMFERPVEAQS